MFSQLRNAALVLSSSRSKKQQARGRFLQQASEVSPQDWTGQLRWSVGGVLRDGMKSASRNERVRKACWDVLSNEGTLPKVDGPVVPPAPGVSPFASV